MMDLDRFFKSPFAAPEISDDELRSFTEDHLQRLSAANEGGEFDDRLAATTGAFVGFSGEVDDQDLTAALLKAATASMGTTWRSFLNWLTSRGEARVVDKTGAGSALYVTLFPRGMSEYHSAVVVDRVVLLNRVFNAVTGDHEDVGTLLGADFVTEVTAFRTAYVAAREAQVALKGEKADNSLDRSVAKAALADALFETLLVLAQRHRGQPGAAAAYFNQSLLED